MKSQKKELKSQGIRILRIQEGSAAQRAGLQAGDVLLELDARRIEDALDLRFYLRESPELTLGRDRQHLRVRLEVEDDSDPGWDLEPMQVRTCHCNCIFCFVHQLPQDLRPSLFIKDEDYRFSFLFGNYLTLVGFTSRDLERAVRMRLSPLYVSIHATDPILRGRLLGVKRAPILPMLEKLIHGGITLHGQIVLVPGWNDGEALEKSLNDLAPLCPGLASLAVVPVGLTRHRQRLTELRGLNAEEAKAILWQIERFQERMIKDFGRRWVYPADELLLLAKAPIPAEKAYEGYPQLENGVGLCRYYSNEAEKALKQLLVALPEKRRILWITGHSASANLQDIAVAFSHRIRNLKINVLAVNNELLGDSVTVAGLLGGRDIVTALHNYLSQNADEPFDAAFLPPDCVNSDGLLLDDWTADRIGQQIGMPVEVFNGDWVGMIRGREAEVAT